MSEIKSEKAKEYISKCFHNNVVGYNRHEVMDIVSIAETEAEQRHEQQLQAVHNMYKEMFIEHERDVNFNIHHSENNHAIELQELRDRAVEAINTALCYYGCSKGKYCEEPCERRDLIIQKLTEKQ